MTALLTKAEMPGNRAECTVNDGCTADRWQLLRCSGWVEPGGYDRVVFRGDVDRREFIAFWVKDGRVLAGMNVNVWDVTDDIQKLVRAGYGGRAVDLERLADRKVALQGCRKLIP